MKNTKNKKIISFLLVNDALRQLRDISTSELNNLACAVRVILQNLSFAVSEECGIGEYL